MIPAFGSQTVRFFINGGDRLKDGTYWTRLMVTARDPRRSIDSSTTKTVQLDFGLVTKQNAIIIFPKGKCTTGLKLVDANVSTDNDNTNLFLKVDKTAGNSPYWGTMELTIDDPSGKEILKEKYMVQVYESSKIKYAFPRNKFKSGKYTFKINIKSERDEIPAEYRMKLPDISEKYEFNIQ